MIRRELKFIGEEDNIEDSKPVIGKGGEGGGDGPNAVPEFLNQYAIGGGGGARFLENVSELGGWVLGRRDMSLHAKEILRSFYGEEEQFEGMASGCSGIGMHGLDIAGDVLKAGVQRQVVRGEGRDEGGGGYVKLIRHLFHRIASGESSAGLVFYQGGEGDSHLFRKRSHGHAAGFPYLFQRDRKTVFRIQKITSLFLT